MTPIQVRAKAAQETLDRFRGKPFRLGRCDCARLVLFHLKAIGSPVKGPPANSYRTVAQAKEQLKKLGYDSLGRLLDDHFERIPPAAAVVGDVLEMPGAKGLSGLGIALGSGRVVSYHEDFDGAEVGQVNPAMVIGAWRVLPSAP